MNTWRKGRIHWINAWSEDRQARITNWRARHLIQPLGIVVLDAPSSTGSGRSREEAAQVRPNVPPKRSSLEPRCIRERTQGRTLPASICSGRRLYWPWGRSESWARAGKDGDLAGRNPGRRVRAATLRARWPRGTMDSERRLQETVFLSIGLGPWERKVWPIGMTWPRRNERAWDLPRSYLNLIVKIIIT
jgi:hypothetical protein